MIVYVVFTYVPFNPRTVKSSLIVMIVQVVNQSHSQTPGNPMPQKECELTSVCSVRFSIQLTVKVGQSRPSMIYQLVIQWLSNRTQSSYTYLSHNMHRFNGLCPSKFPIHSPLKIKHTIMHITYITCQIIHGQHTRHLDTQVTTYLNSAFIFKTGCFRTF